MTCESRRLLSSSPRGGSVGRALLGLVASLPLLGVGVANAQPADASPEEPPPTRVEIDCRLIAHGDDNELEARARLTLAALYRAAPSRVVLRCDSDEAWIAWGEQGDRIFVEKTAWLVEAFLDALERQVRVVKTQAARLRELPPETPRPARLGEPKPVRVFGPGGAGLRWALEPVHGAASVIMGPRLDIGVGVANHFSLVVTEGIRSAPGDDDTRAVHLIDVKLGLAYGAPFDGSLFGIQLSGGNEWLYSSAALLSAPSFDLAGRVAIYRHKLALWLDVAAIVRGRELELLEPNIRTDSPAVMVSIGGFWRAIEPLRDQ